MMHSWHVSSRFFHSYIWYHPSVILHEKILSMALTHFRGKLCGTYIHKCVSFNKGVGMEGSEMGAIYFKWPALRHMGEKKTKIAFFSRL